jgi:hypothetical protein
VCPFACNRPGYQANIALFMAPNYTLSDLLSWPATDQATQQQAAFVRVSGQSPGRLFGISKGSKPCFSAGRAAMGHRENLFHGPRITEQQHEVSNEQPYAIKALAGAGAACSLA